MSQSFDLDAFANKISKKSYKFAEVKDRLEKVAFDVYRFKNASSPDELWQVESGNDGEYIVALYTDEEDKAPKTASNWNIIVKNAEVNIFYKGEFLHKIASEKLGFAADESSLVTQYLPSKLETNHKLVQALFKEVDQNIRQAFIAKYPELA